MLLNQAKKITWSSPDSNRNFLVGNQLFYLWTTTPVKDPLQKLVPMNHKDFLLKMEQDPNTWPFIVEHLAFSFY